MKKWALRSLALMVLGGILVGCGAKKEDKPKGANEKQTITYAIWDTNQEAGMKKMAEAFEKKQPNIKVNVEVTPWDQYWTKLDAAATGESLPDVFWMHSNEAHRYMSNGILQDLNDLTKDDKKINMTKFPKEISQLYSLKDKQYAIPKDIDTIALWYNKTLFDKAGLAYPDDSWTWDTFLEAAKKLTDEKNGVYGFAAPNNGHEGYWNFIYQNEGKILNDKRTKSEFDQPNTEEAMQFYTDLINKYNVSPTAEQLSENKPVSYMQSGRLGMGLFGSWMLADFKDNEYMVKNTDVAVLPKGKTRATVYNGLGNAVSASSKNKEAALDFVAFLGSEEANLISAEMGAAIPAYEGTSAKWINSSKEFNTKVYIDMMEYDVIRPFSNQMLKVETIETDNLANLLNNKASVADVSKKIVQEVDEVLK